MPPEPTTTARWKLIAGYTAFALASFIFFLYLTFPYGAIRDRVQAESGAFGWNVQLGDLGPGLFGVTARDVKVSRVPDPNRINPGGDAAIGAATPPVPLLLASVSARPALFPPGLSVRANAFGGIINGSVGLLGDLKLNADASELNPADGSIEAATGIKAEGLVDASLSLAVPREETAPPGAPRGYDLSKATGTLSLDLSKATIRGGTVTVPMYGQPTPMDLPRIGLGDVVGRLKFDKGAGTIEQLRAKSEDLEVVVTGTVTLAKRVEYSELNVSIKLKPEPEFVKRLGLIGAGLSVLPTDPQDPNFRVATITGFLGRPTLPRIGR